MTQLRLIGADHGMRFQVLRLSRCGEVPLATVTGVVQNGWGRTIPVEMCCTAWSHSATHLLVRFDVSWSSMLRMSQARFDALHGFVDALGQSLVDPSTTAVVPIEIDRLATLAERQDLVLV